MDTLFEVVAVAISLAEGGSMAVEQRVNGPAGGSGGQSRQTLRP